MDINRSNIRKLQSELEAALETEAIIKNAIATLKGARDMLKKCEIQRPKRQNVPRSSIMGPQQLPLDNKAVIQLLVELGHRLADESDFEADLMRRINEAIQYLQEQHNA